MAKNPSKSLDEMMEEAKINPTSLKRLSDNFPEIWPNYGGADEKILLSEVTAATGAYSTECA